MKKGCNRGELQKEKTNGVLSITHEEDLSQTRNPPPKHRHARHPTTNDLIFHIKHSRCPQNNLMAENITH